MTKTRTKTTMVNVVFRIPPQTKKKLERVAERERQTASEIIRDLIDNWLKDN